MALCYPSEEFRVVTKIYFVRIIGFIMVLNCSRLIYYNVKKEMVVINPYLFL